MADPQKPVGGAPSAAPPHHESTEPAAPAVISGTVKAKLAPRHAVRDAITKEMIHSGGMVTVTRDFFDAHPECFAATK